MDEENCCKCDNASTNSVELPEPANLELGVGSDNLAKAATEATNAAGLQSPVSVQKPMPSGFARFHIRQDHPKVTFLSNAVHC